MSAAAQRSIVEWFDATYERRGSRYLRPLRAYLIFPELLGAGPHHSLLDIACGTGLLLRAASEYTQRLHGCDISSVAVRQARSHLPNANLLVANAQALPYHTGTFDLVTCLGSLERMLDRRRALAEMLRVGSPTARYCFLVRNSNTRSWRHGTSSVARQPSQGHADADNLANWKTLFEAVGFRILQVLPDQYPLLRRRRWLGLFVRPVNFRSVVTSRTPLEHANEFIFVLEKRL